MNVELLTISLHHSFKKNKNLAHFDQIPAMGFEVIVLSVKIQGGSGAPLRIVAVMNE
ncbi:hypothetical protein AAG747_12940 [Rapidithrix thailandica]|uniref:Uncharacterized protein n=1 Tax=Rapidithrix thailandica TaxID=413964 RepID=A0AAW9S8R0_9BACT